VWRAEVSIQDAIAAALEMARGEPLPFPAQPVVGVLFLLRRRETPPAGPEEKTGDESDKAHVA
jgi:hypothetical protein